MDGKYSDGEIRARLAGELPGWSYEGGQLRREFPTGSWARTMALAGAFAVAAAEMDHHPDIHLAYAKIAVSVMTHSAGGITEKDFALARRLEELA